MKIPFRKKGYGTILLGMLGLLLLASLLIVITAAHLMR